MADFVVPDDWSSKTGPFLPSSCSILYMLQQMICYLGMLQKGYLAAKTLLLKLYVQS